MELIEKPLKAEYIYKGKIVNLRVDDALLPNGETAKREVVEHGGGVAVLPLTDDGFVVMVEQFRYPYMKTVLEIPAGKKEKGEEPIVCGIRELKEEAGITAKEILSLGELYPTPGYCGEIIYMFLARGLTFGSQNTDEDEFLNVKKVPFEKAVEMVLSGEIKDAKTGLALLKTKIMLDNSKK